MSRPRWLAALAVVALMGAAAGCSNDDGGSESSTSAGGGTDAASHEQAVKFSECMRGNGVPNFPDPDPSGEYNFGVDVTPRVFTQAIDACKDLQPPGSLSAERTPEQQEASLQFAQCIRENGVKDFPDPANGEPLVDTTKIPSTDTPEGMTILNAAMATCGDLVEEAAGSQEEAAGGQGG